MIKQKLQNIGLAVFTLSDVCAFLEVKRSYARLLVHRLVAKKELVKLGGGKYCLPGTNAYAVASRLVFPSYVSFLSALSFHQATTQMPIVITVACSKSKKSIEYEGWRIEFVKMPGRLFGYRKWQVGSNFALVADVEKAIVDTAFLPAHGSLSEAFNALGNTATGTLLDYALNMNRGIVLKRLGLMLEKTGVDASKELGGKISRKYDALDPSFPAEGEKNKKWKLIENTELTEE